MLLIDSLFINNSGGKVLLDYLVKELESNKIETYYLFDKRCEGDFSTIPHYRKCFLNANIIDRHLFYNKNLFTFSKVFCFGNLPPTIHLNVPVYTYFHNVSLFYYPKTYSWKEKLLKRIKSKVISYFKNNTDYFLVQTYDVRNLLVENLHIPLDKSLVIPFFNLKAVKKVNVNKNSFVFISNGNTHKNHRVLISAWYELAKQNLFPELHLTITENFKELISEINAAQIYGLKIINHGYTDAYSLYETCEYLIYPSLCESFGLGLVEAVKCGCKVIASDLPYVHEVVSPTATFDPMNPKSIASSVKEVLGGRNKKESELKVENRIDQLLKLLST